jgi:hypothetical protein
MKVIRKNIQNSFIDPPFALQEIDYSWSDLDQNLPIFLYACIYSLRFSCIHSPKNSSKASSVEELPLPKTSHINFSCFCFLLLRPTNSTSCDHSCVTKRWVLLFVITKMTTMRLINSGVVKQLADKLGKSTLTSNLKGSCEFS